MSAPKRRRIFFFCLDFRGKRLANTFIILVVAHLVILLIPTFRRFDLAVPRLPNHSSDLFTSTFTTTFSNEASCKDFQKIHVIFSSGCSLSQYWQSYVFFYHAMRVGQQGNITRIVSGCSAQEQRTLARRHEREISRKMSKRYRIHFTPDYANYTRGHAPFKYLNKPFGVRHWMEHVLGYPHPNVAKKYDDTIIALLDPDMLLTKPLVNHFDGFPTHNPYNKASLYLGENEICAGHGNPITQKYNYGNDWIASVAGHLADVVGDRSPVHNISEFDAETGYSAGPPYFITARDLYKVVLPWCEFTLRILPFEPDGVMAEMFGYSMAIAHLQLQHRLDLQMMVSYPLLDYEGWQFLDSVPPEAACDLEQVRSLPLVIHYCQEYSVGIHVVSKYEIDDNFISCEAPILYKPTSDLAVRHHEWHHANGSFVPFKDLDQAKRVSFMFCTFTDALNQAAFYFKKHHCGEDANFNETSFYYLNNGLIVPGITS